MLRAGGLSPETFQVLATQRRRRCANAPPDQRARGPAEIRWPPSSYGGRLRRGPVHRGNRSDRPADPRRGLPDRGHGQGDGRARPAAAVSASVRGAVPASRCPASTPAGRWRTRRGARRLGPDQDLPSARTPKTPVSSWWWTRRTGAEGWAGRCSYTPVSCSGRPAASGWSAPPWPPCRVRKGPANRAGKPPASWARKRRTNWAGKRRVSRPGSTGRVRQGHAGRAGRGAGRGGLRGGARREGGAGRRPPSARRRRARPATAGGPAGRQRARPPPATDGPLAGPSPRRSTSPTSRTWRAGCWRTRRWGTWSGSRSRWTPSGSGASSGPWTRGASAGTASPPCTEASGRLVRVEPAQPGREHHPARLAADHHRRPGAPGAPPRPALQGRESRTHPGVQAGAAGDRHLPSAAANSHMITINEQLGFRPAAGSTEWQHI